MCASAKTNRRTTGAGRGCASMGRAYRKKPAQRSLRWCFLQTGALRRNDDPRQLRVANCRHPGNQEGRVLPRAVGADAAAGGEEDRITGETAPDRRETLRPQLTKMRVEPIVDVVTRRDRGGVHALPGTQRSWLIDYNHRRPHQGRWCFGKTPMQTFLDAIPLAKEKLMAA
jgi:hypothetical protein